MIKLILGLLVAFYHHSAGDESQGLLFYRSKPSFEPVKLEVDGYIQIPGNEPLLLNHDDDGVKISLKSQEFKSSKQDQIVQEQGYGQVQQRFLGLGSVFYFPALGKTQTIIQTTTSTSVKLPYCIICTCIKGAADLVAGDCGGDGIIPAPAVCGAGPSVAAVPAPCPNRRRRGFLYSGSVTEDEEEINPSRVLPLVPTAKPFMPEARSYSGVDIGDVELKSSREDSVMAVQGRKVIVGGDSGFKYVVTSFITAVTTVAGTLTAQIQVGSLNCLPAYLQTAPRCAAVGQ